MFLWLFGISEVVLVVVDLCIIYSCFYLCGVLLFGSCLSHELLDVSFFFVTFTALCDGEAVFMKLCSGFAAACSHSLSVVVSHISLLCFHKQCEFSEYIHAACA